MAAPNIETIVSLSKRRGFVYPASEIYGGLGSSWDYGPLGVELANNIKKSWWNWLVYERDELANDFRMVAMDLRGHGRSEKPRDAYGNSQLWADDVKATIDELGLDRPILVGWSYGPLIILDYIRHYGENAIGGINFIGGVTKLGSDEAMAVLTPEFRALVPGFFSTDTEESVYSLESLLRMCLAPQPADEDLLLMLGCSVMTPSYVRQAMFARSFDNDDILPNVRKPLLLTHGAADRVVKPISAEQIKSAVPNAQLDLVEAAEHAVFWDRAKVYNDRLRAFAETAISERAAEA